MPHFMDILGDPNAGHNPPPGQRPGDQLRPPSDPPPPGQRPSDQLRPPDPAPPGFGSGDPFGDPEETSGSIFGWSWLGRWADTLPGTPEGIAVRGFINKWVKKFEDSLDSEGPTFFQDAFLNEFQNDLKNQTWWADKTSVWQALNKLQYGTGPGADYRRLINNTRKYIDTYTMQMGVEHSLTDADITEMILDAGRVSGGVITLDTEASDAWIDRAVIGKRTTGGAEGAIAAGAGTLQDLYNTYKGYADNNFTTFESEQLWDLVGRVKRDELSEAAARDQILDWTDVQHGWLDPKLMEKIRANPNVSLSSHLSPLKTTLANTWELDTSEIDLKDHFDSLVKRRPSDYKLLDGESEISGFKNSLEVKQWARKQDQFKETSDYRSGMSNLSSSILQLFGAR